MQVWDLSDQDNDSMLSLREFCIALYLMERFREGRPPPAALPSSILSDEALLSVSNQPATAHGNTVWRATPGIKFIFKSLYPPLPEQLLNWFKFPCISFSTSSA